MHRNTAITNIHSFSFQILQLMAAYLDYLAREYTTDGNKILFLPIEELTGILHGKMRRNPKDLKFPLYFSEVCKNLEQGFYNFIVMKPQYFKQTNIQSIIIIVQGSRQ